MRGRKRERWRSLRTKPAGCSGYAISRPFGFCFVVCSLLFIALALPVRGRKKNRCHWALGGGPWWGWDW